MIRQGVFIAKMHSFGWTVPGYFDDAKDEAVLANAITRYHAYAVRSPANQTTPHEHNTPHLDSSI